MKNAGRKIYHLSGGLLLIGLYTLAGRTNGLAILASALALATSVDIARLRIPAFNAFFYRRLTLFIRESERHRLTGTPPYLLGILLAALLYDAPVCVYAVSCLACGDVAATTVGERWGTIKISGVKSLQGTLAFIAVSVAAGFVISRFWLPVSPMVYVGGALVAALVELMPVRVDDNLTIPVVAGGVMTLLMRSGL